MFFRPQSLDQVGLQLRVIWVLLVVWQFVLVFSGYCVKYLRTGMHKAFAPAANLSGYIYASSFVTLLSIAFGLYIYLTIPKWLHEKSLNKAHGISGESSPNILETSTVRVVQVNSLMAIFGCGAGAVYGGIPSLLGNKPAVDLPFAMASLVALFICRPTKAYYERIAQRVQEWKLQ